MAKQIRDNSKDIEYWKRLASRLAMALAIMIFASGVIGLWMSSEKRALDAFKRSNKLLLTGHKNIRDKLKLNTIKLKECELENEKLMELNKILIDENTDSEKNKDDWEADYDKVDKVLTETIDELDELKKKYEQLTQVNSVLSAENKALTASGNL